MTKKKITKKMMKKKATIKKEKMELQQVETKIMISWNPNKIRQTELNQELK